MAWGARSLIPHRPARRRPHGPGHPELRCARFIFTGHCCRRCAARVVDPAAPRLHALRPLRFVHGRERRVRARPGLALVFVFRLCVSYISSLPLASTTPEHGRVLRALALRDPTESRARIFGAASLSAFSHHRLPAVAAVQIFHHCLSASLRHTSTASLPPKLWQRARRKQRSKALK